MYVLHGKDTNPESGEEFTTREAAFTAQRERKQQSSHKITFVPTEDQLYEWMTRERNRFAATTYIYTPWHSWERFYESYNTDDLTGLTTSIDYPRFPHMSLSHPGMIAYTPDVERGIQDKQLRVRPGKYLEQFMSEHSAHHEEWVAACNATKTTFSIATTADDIEQIYIKSATRSCMTGRQSGAEYDWSKCSQHPVRVYGDSDLAVAYIGDLNAPGRSITARCIIWPEKKVYARNYGDPTLVALLKAHGYTQPDGSYDHVLEGARIRRIAEGDGWLMPYIDGAAGASEGSNRQWLVLCSDYHASLDIKDTKGTTGSHEDTYECSSCNSDVTEDNWHSDYDLCTSCYDDQYADCDGCGATCSRDDMTRINVPHRVYRRDRLYCSDCTSTCELCNTSFSQSSVSATTTIRTSREDRNIHEHLCAGCDTGTNRWCDDCEQVYEPAGDADSACTHCNPPDDDDSNDSASETDVTL